MKSFCCFCKQDDEEDEPEVNPFKDYAPSKGEDAAPPLIRERVIFLILGHFTKSRSKKGRMHDDTDCARLGRGVAN